MVRYRPMTPEDIPAGLALCRFAGWNQTSRDWALFLKMNPQGAAVAVEDNGEIVGTVTTVRYQNHFSWIGMVLVHPEKQRQGIGIQLLRESLRILSEEDTVKLDATPAGREIYLQLNFMDEYPLHRMHIQEVSLTPLGTSRARAVNTKDLTGIFELDRQIFGADRGPLLEWLFGGAPEFAFVLRESDRVTGYCFGRRGQNFAHIGPVVSNDPAAAPEIVSAALRNCAGNAAIIDSLQHSPAWNNWLSSVGFQKQRSLLRMYRGSNAYPGDVQKQFAILGPEFG